MINIVNDENVEDIIQREEEKKKEIEFIEDDYDLDKNKKYETEKRVGEFPDLNNQPQKKKL